MRRSRRVFLREYLLLCRVRRASLACFGAPRVPLSASCPCVFPLSRRAPPSLRRHILHIKSHHCLQRLSSPPCPPSPPPHCFIVPPPSLIPFTNSSPPQHPVPRRRRRHPARASHRRITILHIRRAWAPPLAPPPALGASPAAPRPGASRRTLVRLKPR